jgi:hypothetical protein
MAAPTLPRRIAHESQIKESSQLTRIAPLMVAPSQEQASNTSSHFLRVVVQRPHKHYFLLSSPMSASSTVRDVMQELRKIKAKELSRIKSLRFLKEGLWTTVIETANLSTVSEHFSVSEKPTDKVQFRLADIEAQPNERSLEVIIASRTISPELTAAFHRSRLLRSSAPFADQYPALLSNSPRGTALLIGQQTDKQRIFCVHLMALVLSLVLGLIVGIVYSRADLAVGITAGLTGMLSVCTALSVWMLK